MSSKCTAAKAYDILGIYDFPDDFDALNGLHSYFYASNDMVVEALASQKYDLARDIVTAIETVDKDGSPPSRMQSVKTCRRDEPNLLRGINNL